MTMTATRAHAIGAPGYSETLPCEDESASRARRLVSAALNTWGLDHLSEAATLIVSEFVANAVQHSGCRLMRVSISRPAEGRVHIAVADKSRAAPSLRFASSDEETGRGLVIVDALADRWDTDHRGWGKVVWAECALEAPECIPGAAGRNLEDIPGSNDLPGVERQRGP